MVENMMVENNKNSFDLDVENSRDLSTYVLPTYDLFMQIYKIYRTRQLPGLGTTGINRITINNKKLSFWH